jgi:hypothetical protein
MTAVSLQFTRGQVQGAPPGSYYNLPGGNGAVVVGTAAPTAGYDIEVRYNLTDQNSANLTRLDIRLVLEAVAALITEQGLQQPAGTFTLPGLGV